ncbi:uncharacterized protein DDB_G0283357 [Teleopsis dalmanni]|uniref:uncharacterized protein DDB_G0283357 n=1 Tax=Teleopsis dalmanni TaxID=139649 RepID=UPI0018CCC53E|nr:uncharacterized protein DDB_G0283357 [Teleopsis dalmanni]XP_037958740.1 uncharacterized protein DDB_G0283357 [Teleopsis dalmanni]XP_037958741.1 uncharacterized protein DDB_G0283357 [Teleopsis dalmanni]
MAVVRKKQDDNNLKALRELVTTGAGNRQCFDCDQKGPTYVNMTIGSFVCTRCSGVLRGLTPPHRVKSISMATFTQDELDFIKAHGNEVCAKTWLGLWDPKRVIHQDHRELMVDKYERKRYYLEPASPLKSITNATNALKSIVQNGSSNNNNNMQGTSNLTNGFGGSSNNNHKHNVTTTFDNNFQNIQLTPPTSQRNTHNRQHKTSPSTAIGRPHQNGFHQSNQNQDAFGLSKGLNGSTGSASTGALSDTNSTSSNGFGTDSDFVADFGSANIFDATSTNSAATLAATLAATAVSSNGYAKIQPIKAAKQMINGGHINSNTQQNRINSTANGNTENFADFDHAPIYNSAANNQLISKAYLMKTPTSRVSTTINTHINTPMQHQHQNTLSNNTYLVNNREMENMSYEKYYINNHYNHRNPNDNNINNRHDQTQSTDVIFSESTSNFSNPFDGIVFDYANLHKNTKSIYQINNQTTNNNSSNYVISDSRNTATSNYSTPIQIDHNDLSVINNPQLQQQKQQQELLQKQQYIQQQQQQQQQKHYIQQQQQYVQQQQQFRQQQEQQQQQYVQQQQQQQQHYRQQQEQQHPLTQTAKFTPLAMAAHATAMAVLGSNYHFNGSDTTNRNSNNASYSHSSSCENEKNNYSTSVNNEEQLQAFYSSNYSPETVKTTDLLTPTTNFLSSHNKFPTTTEQRIAAIAEKPIYSPYPHCVTNPFEKVIERSPANDDPSRDIQATMVTQLNEHQRSTANTTTTFASCYPPISKYCEPLSVSETFSIHKTEPVFVESFSPLNPFRAHFIDNSNRLNSSVDCMPAGIFARSESNCSEENFNSNANFNFKSNSILNSKTVCDNVCSWSFHLTNGNISKTSNGNLFGSNDNFRNNNKLSATPPEDRYAALKHLDEQIRESKAVAEAAAAASALVDNFANNTNGNNSNNTNNSSINPFQSTPNTQNQNLYGHMALLPNGSLAGNGYASHQTLNTQQQVNGTATANSTAAFFNYSNGLNGSMGNETMTPNMFNTTPSAAVSGPNGCGFGFGAMQQQIATNGGLGGMVGSGFNNPFAANGSFNSNNPFL